MTTFATGPSAILDLITDPADAADLLQALDLPKDSVVEPPIQALRALLTEHDFPRVFLALTVFASKFARMTESISVFFKHYQIGSNGQLNLADVGIALNLESFRASWVASLDAFWPETAQEQSEAIATAVTSLLEQLRFEEFVYVDRDVLAKRVRFQVANKERQQLTLREQGERDSLTEFCADGDYNAMKFAAMAIEEILHDLARRHLSSTLRAAFEEVATACTVLLRRMESAKIIQGIDANLGVATLADEIYLYATQARALAARFAEADRAQEGLGDFLRSHFWRHRWRVYEIWLLTKTIDILARNGAEISLHAVSQGVWNLPYGQSDSPIATAKFADRTLDVFYQYIERTADSADMPDIFVADSRGEPLLVLDPKHGVSYSRSKVQKVLTRYHNRFRAALTAIVNYFPIRSYRYDLASTADRTWVLASGISPGTVEEQRLEHQIADTACSRGFFLDNTKKQTPKPKKWTPSAQGILYWAGGAREVDELPGAWAYTREHGARSLQRLRQVADMLVEGVEAAEDGHVCAVRASRQLTLISSALEQTVWQTSFEEVIDCLSWNSAGSNLLVKSGEQFTLFDALGSVLMTFVSPTAHWEPLVVWIGRTDTILYAHAISLSRVVAYRFGRDRKWLQILDFVPSQFVSIELSAIQSYKTDEVILQVTTLHAFIISADDVHELSPDTQIDLSISPSGRYHIRRGPVSLRVADGFSLLEIHDVGAKTTSLPLLRFIGELTGSIRWNADESAFGFLTRRRFISGADDVRVSTATIGDRDAITISLPNQAPRGFAWVRADLLRELEVT